MKTRLIVFDIDDTISATASLHQRLFTECLIDLGVQQIDTNYGAYLHHTDSYIAKLIYEKDRGIPFSNAILQEFEKLLYTKLQQYPIQEIEGAQSTISYLKETSNIAIAFATGSLLQPALYKLEQLDLRIDPELVVASNQLETREGIVSNAIDRAKNHYQVDEFDTIISVGDGVWDLKTARNLSLNFIGVSEKNKKVLLENGANTILADLTNFVETVQHQFDS